MDEEGEVRCPEELCRFSVARERKIREKGGRGAAKGANESCLTFVSYVIPCYHHIPVFPFCQLCRFLLSPHSCLSWRKEPTRDVHLRRIPLLRSDSSEYPQHLRIMP